MGMRMPLLCAVSEMMTALLRELREKAPAARANAERFYLATRNAEQGSAQCTPSGTLLGALADEQRIPLLASRDGIEIVGKSGLGWAGKKIITWRFPIALPPFSSTPPLPHLLCAFASPRSAVVAVNHVRIDTQMGKVCALPTLSSRTPPSSLLVRPNQNGRHREPHQHSNA